MFMVRNTLQDLLLSLVYGNHSIAAARGGSRVARRRCTHLLPWCPESGQLGPAYSCALVARMRATHWYRMRHHNCVCELPIAFCTMPKAAHVVP